MARHNITFDEATKELTITIMDGGKVETLSSRNQADLPRIRQILRDLAGAISTDEPAT